VEPVANVAGSARNSRQGCPVAGRIFR